MSINFILVILLFVFIAVISPKYRDRNKYQYLFLLLFLFFYAALRGNGNGDYFEYINRGQAINNLSDVFFKEIGMEIGYKVIAYSIRLLQLPRQTVIIVMNLISFLCLNKFIKRYSSHWTFSLLVFLPIFFQFEMHAARTGVAIAIVSLGYKYIEDREFIKYGIVVLIASMFHSTAIIAIFMYFIYEINIPLKKGIAMILMEFLFIAIVDIDNIVSSLLGNFGLTNFLAKYLAYENSEKFGYELSLMDPRIWIGVVIFIVASIFIKNKSKFSKFTINSTFMYSFILILFSEHTFIAYRLSSYYYYPMIVLIPSIIENGEFSKDDKRVKLVVFYGIVICFTILDSVYALGGVEYIFFWHNIEAVLPWY